MECQPVNPQLLENGIIEAGHILTHCDTYPAICPGCGLRASAMLTAAIIHGGCAKTRDMTLRALREQDPSFTLDPEEN